ncbi:MAG: protein translocase subunit SecF, partial [Candidatus Riflebacteria bacterium]|nr:protein translocase subunit SecF [Candidatus Riflebacteria bacterium]
LYMAFRFEWRPGVACTISLFHDTLAIIAVCCIFHVEIDITVVAAILTVLGSSTNDSIVILDRVRENLRLKRKLPYEELVNLAINQCLVRTIYNSMTTMLPLLALLTVGPSSLWGFSLVLLVGVFEGCYSTFGVVCPICVDWHLYVDKPRQRTDVASQKA